MKYLSLFTALALVLLGCSKKSGSSDNGGTTQTDQLKLTLVSGGNEQADTIGHLAKDSVVLKVTLNNVAAAGYGVELTGSGCNAELPVTIPSQSGGLIKYGWALAGDVGQQTLKAVLKDNNGKRVDSLTVTTHTVNSISGKWNVGACSLMFDAAGFCKLSTGRIFQWQTGSKGFAKYSDDNGVSWHLLTGLTNTHDILAMVSTPADGLLAFASGEGFYYSADAGVTWKLMPAPSLISKNFVDMTSTASGKVFFSAGGSVYQTTDNGATWTTILSNNDPNLIYPSEDLNGNLYVIDNSEELLKSTDGGKNWKVLFSLGNGTGWAISSIYFDKNGWMYIGRSDPDGGLYVSKDGGLTFTALVKAGNIFFRKTTVAASGAIYYDIEQQGFYKVSATSLSPLRAYPSVSVFGINDYIVANKGNLVLTLSAGLTYYFKP